jgi:hypothetical protein
MSVNGNFDRISSVINEFQSNCNPTYLDIDRVYWDRGSNDNDEVVPEIHVVIEEAVNAPPGTNTYCHPVAEFGREQGLFLWDTVTNWEEQTVTLRFQFEE